MNTKDINELCEYYRTDKRNTEHGYAAIYQKYFISIREQVKAILEFGIFDHSDRENHPFGGPSLKVWKNFFPNATVHGADFEDYSYLQEDRLVTHIANQNFKEDLKALATELGPNSMDIIIDDGGHKMHQQQWTLAKFLPVLKPGGIYVIEDLHTSELPEYANSPFTTRTSQMLKDFIATGRINSRELSLVDKDYLELLIDTCVIEQGYKSEIAFITKA